MSGPIFIPIMTPASPPAHCPNCGKPEAVVRSCAHCGMKYAESDDPPWWFIVGCIALGIYVLFTLVHWLLIGTMDDHTLLDTLRGQWEFVRGLRIW